MFLFLTFCFCATAFSQQKQTQVGVIENGKAVLTADKTTLMTNYNKNLLTRSKIDAKFSDVAIVEYERGKFVLVFSGPNHKSAFAITISTNKALAETTTSCTTSDCSQETYGCLVKYESGSEIGYCSPCANLGKCTKTTSNSSLLEYID